MYKLLNANFFRLRKNKVFWGIVIITLFIACVFFFNRMGTNRVGATKGIDQLLLDYINVIGIFLAIFTSIFIGLEYSNGTIRNKIVVGNSRINIYLSNLIISIVAGIFIELIYMLFISIIGIPVIGGLQMSISQFVFILLDIIMIIMTYSSIFTLISLICMEITTSTVINIILVLAMFVAAASVTQTANAQEFLHNTILNEQGETEQVLEPNPNYPGETKKKVAQTLLYILPTGQATQISGYKENIYTKSLLLYSLVVSILLNVIGIYCFSKEDLK